MMEIERNIARKKMSKIQQNIGIEKEIENRNRKEMKKNDKVLKYRLLYKKMMIEGQSQKKMREGKRRREKERETEK